MLAAIAASGVCALIGPATASSNTSHAGWPPVTGMLLINATGQSRPLDGRPGSDPWDGTDNSKLCRPGRHNECVPNGIPVAAVPGGVTCSGLAAAEAALSAQLQTPPPMSACSHTLAAAALVPAGIGHNELLGGGGNDTIHAGPAGDVIWGAFLPGGQLANQVDYLYGGAGNDFIYAGHGVSYIHTGGGTDVVHAHFGRGEIHCDSAAVTVFLSRSGRRGWKLFGCRHISYTTVGY
jgi:hypothetical protein